MDNGKVSLALRIYMCATEYIKNGKKRKKTVARGPAECEHGLCLSTDWALHVRAQSGDLDPIKTSTIRRSLPFSPQFSGLHRAEYPFQTVHTPHHARLVRCYPVHYECGPMLFWHSAHGPSTKVGLPRHDNGSFHFCLRFMTDVFFQGASPAVSHRITN